MNIFFFLFFFQVNFTVNFNYNAGMCTIKINNIITNTMLSCEFKARNLPFRSFFQSTNSAGVMTCLSPLLISFSDALLCACMVYCFCAVNLKNILKTKPCRFKTSPCPLLGKRRGCADFNFFAYSRI
jgi:hypothetical protein